ncbi:hypothetical protein FRC06_002483 [Ceratobasidium sp. 370]|nr:hypothetical protein FRC06_002483 [Ceratobasidium sp. 370]
MQMQREGATEDKLWPHIERLGEHLKKATYIVEVYWGNAPTHILGWLAENNPDRLNFAPLAGEKLWQLCRNQEGWVERMVTENKAVDHIDTLNKMFSIWDAAVQGEELTKQQREWVAALDVWLMGLQAKPKDAKVRLSWKGAWELMVHPVLNNMVLDTKAALWVYNM